MKNIFLHPTAIVETKDIGQATSIWQFCHIMENVSIGLNCNIGSHCFIESGAIIGNNVTIKNGSMIWDGVTIDYNVFIGPNVNFINDLCPRSPRLAIVRKRYSDKSWLLSTEVEQGASIGAGAIIVPGLKIGEFSMVGAGSVVTKNIIPYSLVLGNPARFKGWVCQCGQPVLFQNQKAYCTECKSIYRKDGEKISLILHHSDFQR